MSDEVKKILTIDTGKSQKSVGDLRKEIKELRSQLLSLEQGSEQYNAVAQQLGDTMHQLVEVQEAAKYATADFGQTVSNMSSMMGAASSSIGAATGVLSMFGVEVAKDDIAVTKIIATFMSISQAASQIDTATKAYKGLNQRLITFIASKKAEKVALAQSTAATVAETTAMGADAVATKGAEVAQRGFNAAIKANPLGALLAVITAVISGVVALVKALKSIADSKADKYMDNLTKEMKKYDDEMNKAIFNQSIFLDYLDAIGASEEEKRRQMFKDATENLKKQQEKVDRLEDEYRKAKRDKDKEQLKEDIAEARKRENELYQEQSKIRQTNENARIREERKAEEDRKKAAESAAKERKRQLEEQRKQEEQAAKDLLSSQKELQKSYEELGLSRLEGESKIQAQINLYTKLIEKLEEEKKALPEGSTEWNKKQTEINNTTKALEGQLQVLGEYYDTERKNTIDKKKSQESNEYTKKGYDIDNSEYDLESQRLEAKYQLEVEHVNRLKELYQEYFDSNLITKEEFDANIIDLDQKLKDKEIAIAEQKKEERIALEEATFSAIESISGSLTGVLSSIADNYEESSSTFKNLKIAETIISTATSIMKTWEGYASMGIPGTIAAAAQSAALVTTGALQIAKIKRVKTDGSQNSDGGGAKYSINTQSVTSATSDYSKHQLEQIAENTNTSANTRVYVLASDISEALESKKVKIASNTF